MEEQLKQLFLTESLSTIIKRIQIIVPKYNLESVCRPVIVNAEIVDNQEVLEYIHSIWPFNIKDIRIDINHQKLYFKIFGDCYVNKQYSSYILFENNFSLEPTEEFNYHKTIKEEYAEENAFDLKQVPGIKLEYV